MYDIAEIGARKQEKSAAFDLAEEAKAGVKQVESLTVDKTLNAPLDAQVDKVILVEGEIAAAGFPVVTLVDLNDQWASFNIREENMPGVEIGKVLHAYVPALGDKKIDYKVYYISPRANYATWRSTRMDSGYDMKTFEVRARPVEKIDHLRPGMSVLVEGFKN
jgi:HlyD family secretion protein